MPATPFVPTATPNYITGQVVAVQVGTKLMYCLSGNAKESSKVVIRTNSQSKGKQEVRFGSSMISGSLKLAYNGDDPPTMRSGTFATLIIDTVGHEIDEAQENGAGGTPTTPTGELITMNAAFTDVDRNWNADSGDYSWDVSYTSSGDYQIASATGATATT